jgi:RNA polymerase sigma-70 factor (ECF subfamily)
VSAALTHRLEASVGPVACSNEETRLVAAAAGGDLDAFEALYRRSVGVVHALVRRLTRDAREAEELTQDVYLRAWQRLGSFRGESGFATWLVRLAVNVALNNRREWSRHGGRLELVADLEPIAGSSGAHLGAERIDLERAISKLPIRARVVFVLHDVQGFGHDEIAQGLGIAAGTSKAHLHRARALLREALRP